MTDTNTTYNLSITQPDQSGGTKSINMTTDMPEEIVRLLQLSGQEGGKTFTLNMNSTNKSGGVVQDETCSVNVNITSNDPATIIKAIAPDSCDCDDGCDDDCDCECHDMVEIDEQQAEYDYGHRKSPRDACTTFDIKDYNFKGKADLPERLSSARFGSNPLASEMRESLYQDLVSRYQDYLKEDRENEMGMQSPLTANQRMEFDHDPLHSEEPVSDGSRSPMSRIKRQKLPK
jgi:hypothetical protein